MRELKEAKKADQKHHWDEVFATNPEFFGKGPSRFAQRSLDVLQRHGARSLLELGCGQGRDTFLFARAGLEVTALDYSETVVSAVRDKAGAAVLPGDIRVQVHDVRNPLPFPDNSFDACYSHMLLCMQLTTAEIEFIVRETHRILKPDGLMLYSVRNTYDKHYRRGTRLGEEIYEIGGFVVHFFSEEKVRDLAAGFATMQIERMEEGSLPRDLFAVSLRKLAGALPPKPEKNEEEKNMSEAMKKFQAFLDASLAPGVLENKTKQLVALGAALAAGCDT